VQARIWGCRGSLAAPGRRTLRYGGNTSCVEVVSDGGTRIVLDAGTGIRALGATLGPDGERPVHLLLTHLHLDHIEGLGFFAPIWSPGRRISVWGPPSPLRTLRERVARYFSPPLFPVDLGDIPSEVAFADAGPEPWTIGDVTVSAHPVQHPGPTVAYRLESGGRSLAYLPDHEPALGVPLDSLDETWVSGADAAWRADVLLHDGQYSDEEYEDRVGWGHSSVTHAVEFARRVGAARLVLVHHDPARDDAALERLGARAAEREANSGGVRVELGYEGMEIEV
jgi:phosphoribosyl 1,2-cyclic phosphodiesterase